MKQKIKKLYLMVHPTPRNAEKVEKYFKRWNHYLTEAAQDPAAALCILSNSPPEMAELRENMKQLFGERCIVDPDDWSEATRLLYVDMVEKTLGLGGWSFPKSNLYGLWTAKNALRWAEGLKRELVQRGFSYSPSNLRVFGFGAMWGGCMTKYVGLMSSQLGVCQTPEIIPELCGDAGFPINSEYLEKQELSDHVWVFLFRANNGIYFAQFMDSLKPVFKPAKTVRLQMKSDDYFIHTSSFNAYFTPDKSAVISDDDSIEFPVMDGYFSPNITIFCRHGDYSLFKKTVFATVVKHSVNSSRQLHHSLIPYLESVNSGLLT